MQSKKVIVACALVVTAIASVVLAPASARADMTDAEVLAMAGPRTCKDGPFPYKYDGIVEIPIFTLDPNILYEFCFKLPRIPKSQLGQATNGIVQLNTVNLGDSSCGTIDAFMIKPKRKSIFGSMDQSRRTSVNLNSSQPGGALTYTPGVWRVLFRYVEGCNKYKVAVSW